jgi:integrase
MGVTVREKVKGSGKWYVVIHFNGRRKYKAVGSRAAAKEVAKRLEARIALGEYSPEPKKEVFTYRRCADLFLSGYGNHGITPSTLRRYESTNRCHLVPAFGRQPIDKITRAEIREFLLGKLEEGKRPSTVNQMAAVLSGVFKQAMEDGLVEANPAAGMTRYLTNKNNRDAGTVPDPYTASELWTFLETAREHFPRYYPFFLLLARTGLRLGEARALQWRDVNFEKGVIEVQRSFADGKLGKPKSGRGRSVTMTDGLKAVLAELRDGREAEAKRHGWPEVPQWVFVNQAGNAMDERNIRWRGHEEITKRSGLRRINLHGFRRTYTTLRVAAGHIIANVQKELGHSSIRTTIDKYHRWMPGQNETEVAELDQMGKPEGENGGKRG